MEHSAVTVIASLKPDTDVSGLDLRLRGMGGRLSREERLPADPDFAGICGMHFLRLLIIKDPDRGADRWRLLLAAVIDGDDVDGFLGRLGEITPDLDAIWGDCEDYRGGDDFVAFMLRNSHEASAFYVAFKNETLAEHRRYDALRRRWDDMSANRAGEALDGPPPWRRKSRPFSWSRMQTRVWSRSCRFFARWWRLFGQLRQTFRDGVEMWRKHGFRATWAGTTTIVRGLNRYFGWWLFNMLTGNIEQPRRPRLSQIPIDKQPPPAESSAFPGQLDPGSHLPWVEDRVVQNQLTLVTPIANSTPAVNQARLNQLGAVLGAVDSYSRIWSRPGDLLGMSTIHFVRWMPIDDGRRLLMLSDYDHSWEAYIDEFIEMIRTGMDAIWSCAAETDVAAYKTGPSEDYLANYLEKGSGDAMMFKNFLRQHQANAHIFYSAYPRRTVLHTREDRQRFKDVSLGMCDLEFHARVQENSYHADT